MIRKEVAEKEKKKRKRKVEKRGASGVASSYDVIKGLAQLVNGRLHSRDLELAMLSARLSRFADSLLFRN